MRLLTSILLITLLTGCCTRIQSLTPSAFPITAGPHTVTCRTNSGAAYVMVDGVRVPMRRVFDDVWKAEVFLRDGSIIWFEAIVPTKKQQIHVVSRQVR